MKLQATYYRKPSNRIEEELTETVKSWVEEDRRFASATILAEALILRRKEIIAMKGVHYTTQLIQSGPIGHGICVISNQRGKTFLTIRLQPVSSDLQTPQKMNAVRVFHGTGLGKSTKASELSKGRKTVFMQNVSTALIKSDRLFSCLNRDTELVVFDGVSGDQARQIAGLASLDEVLVNPKGKCFFHMPRPEIIITTNESVDLPNHPSIESIKF